MRQTLSVSFCTCSLLLIGADRSTAVVMADNKGNPYANEINIGVNYGKQDGFNEFLCELIVEGLSTAAMALFPELLPAEEAEQMSFEALCGTIGEFANAGS